MRTAQQYLKLWALVYILLRPASISAQLTLNSPIRNVVSATSLTNHYIQSLTVGDQVPDIVFENVLNYKSKSAKLSDFKGRLVILDLWSTWCSNCIAAFPKMESLQKRFGEKIQILLVNPYRQFDSEERIKLTLDRLKARTGFYPDLPIPIHDTILNYYFPRESVPHQVWIDGNGMVVGITGATDVTFENIQSILEGRHVSMPIKNDWAFDRMKPLLMSGNGGNDENYIFRSIFTGYVGGIGFGSGVRRNENNEVTGCYILNNSLQFLISMAYSDIMKGLNSNRVILEVKNQRQYSTEFDPAYTYCYDLTMPPISTDSFDMKRYLREDLKRVFNISVGKIKRMKKVFVISWTEKLDNLYTKHKDRSVDLDKSSINRYFHNCSVEEIIRLLDRFDMPLLNEVDVNRHIDIDFPTGLDLSDVREVTQYLQKLGFRLQEEIREIEMIMITDK